MESEATNFEEWLRQYAAEFAPVVPFNSSDKLLLMNFTEKNKELTDENLNNTNLFIQYINKKLKEAGAKYGIGGYGENRMIYRRSAIFGANGPSPTTSLSGKTPFSNENMTAKGEASSQSEVNALASPPAGNLGERGSRSLHLGTDIWGAPYTKVMSPINGIVHSFAFNNAFGDYGATIILTHNIEGISFHTLYGHLSLNSIKNLHEGDVVKKGDVIAEFGIPFENGQWPPHLHFQIIKDLQGMKGDYPGVCALSEKEFYLANCPDADLILRMMQYASET